MLAYLPVFLPLISLVQLPAMRGNEKSKFRDVIGAASFAQIKVVQMHPKN
jgi:hypothetical protein